MNNPLVNCTDNFKKMESEKMALTENGEIEDKREIRKSKKKQQLGGIRTLPFIFGKFFFSCHYNVVV